MAKHVPSFQLENSVSLFTIAQRTSVSQGLSKRWISDWWSRQAAQPTGSTGSLFSANKVLAVELRSCAEKGEGTLRRSLFARGKAMVKKQFRQVDRLSCRFCFNQSEAQATSSVRNFCSRFSDVISRGTQWPLAVFQAIQSLKKMVSFQFQ